MASHARKRQFQPSAQQPSITSYFTRSTGPSSSDSAAQTGHYRSSSTHTPSLSPPLPDHVQSLLINVGMRVRKSVPEGYKTHKTLVVSSAPPSHMPATAASMRPPTSSAPAATEQTFSRARELAPFCGLHSVGGYAVQSQPDVSAVYGLATPGLSYSQDSLSSSAPAAGQYSSRKRSYDDEIEDELDAYFEAEDDVVSDAEEGVATAAGTGRSRPGLLSGVAFGRQAVRPKARMKGAVAGEAALRASFAAPMDRARGRGDFDDSDVGFLQPMEVDF